MKKIHFLFLFSFFLSTTGYAVVEMSQGHANEVKSEFEMVRTSECRLSADSNDRQDITGYNEVETINFSSRVDSQNKFITIQIVMKRNPLDPRPDLNTEIYTMPIKHLEFSDWDKIGSPPFISDGEPGEDSINPLWSLKVVFDASGVQDSRKMSVQGYWRMFSVAEPSAPYDFNLNIVYGETVREYYFECKGFYKNYIREYEQKGQTEIRYP